VLSPRPPTGSLDLEESGRRNEVAQRGERSERSSATQSLRSTRLPREKA